MKDGVFVDLKNEKISKKTEVNSSSKSCFMKQKCEDKLKKLTTFNSLFYQLRKLSIFVYDW